jgi:hypothetical protein
LWWTASLLSNFHVQCFVNAALKLVYLRQSSTSNGDIGFTEISCLSLSDYIVVNIWCNLCLDQTKRSSDFCWIHNSFIIQVNFVDTIVCF